MSRSVELERMCDEAPGRKKSRFKALKSRLLGRIRRKDPQGSMKQSQSASDAIAPEPIKSSYDSEEDLLSPKGTLSSRAFSHDSIFLTDPAQTPAEPPRVSSQENVHSKIRALQVRLQQQNFHLGPPPLLIPKRHDDPGATSEDDGLPHSPPDLAFQDGGQNLPPHKLLDAKRNYSSLSLAGTGSEEEEQFSSQPSSRPLSPLSMLRPRSQSSSSHAPPSVDFSCPAHFSPSLDTSAARHRMAVKPRNQRPSNKRKLPSSVYRPRAESMHDLSHALLEGEEECLGGAEEKLRFRSLSSYTLRDDPDDLIFVQPHNHTQLDATAGPPGQPAHTPDTLQGECVDTAERVHKECVDTSDQAREVCVDAPDEVQEECVDAPEECVNLSEQFVDAPEECVTLSEQSVDAPEECVTLSEQSVDAPEECVNASEQSVDAPEECVNLSAQCVDTPEECVNCPTGLQEDELGQTATHTTPSPTPPPQIPTPTPSCTPDSPTPPLLTQATAPPAGPDGTPPLLTAWPLVKQVQRPSSVEESNTSTCWRLKEALRGLESSQTISKPSPTISQPSQTISQPPQTISQPSRTAVQTTQKYMASGKPVEPERPGVENLWSGVSPSPMQGVKGAPGGEKRNSLVIDIRPQSGGPADTPPKSSTPVPTPRATRPMTPTLQGTPLHRTDNTGAKRETQTQASSTPTETAPPTGQENQVPTAPKSTAQSGASHFSISSARRRSRAAAGGERNLANTERKILRSDVEEKSKIEKGNGQETPTNTNNTPLKSKDPEEGIKDSGQKQQLTLEKRFSLRGAGQNIPFAPATAGKATDDLGGDEKGREPGGTRDGGEHRKAFGVTLRNTSLSLRHRSESANQDVSWKRHSMEVASTVAILEEAPRSTCHRAKEWSRLLHTPDNSEKPLEVLGSTPASRNTPPWGRSRTQPPPPVTPVPPVVTPVPPVTTPAPSEETPARAVQVIATPQPPALNPSPPQMLPSNQLKAVSSPLSPKPMLPPKPTTRGPSDRLSVSRLSDSTLLEKLEHVHLAEGKRWSLSRLHEAPPGDLCPAKPPTAGSFGTYDSPTQLEPTGSQPSWMLLAKRKSSAWSDRSPE